MKLEGTGKLLRIYIGEADTWHGKPLFAAIVERLREHGLAGATVLRGIEGYGARSRIHTARLLRLSEDLPLVIEAVDLEDRVRSVLPMLDDMIEEGLVTLETVELIVFRSPEDEED